MNWRHILIATAACACFTTSIGRACSLDLLAGDGLAVEHPGTILVAVSVNRAITEGRMERLPEPKIRRIDRLRRVQVLATRHMTKLLTHAVREPGPPVHVLLTQSGAWMTIGGDGRPPAFHTNPPPPNSPIVLIPDLAYEALIRGDVSAGDLERRGLVLFFGKDPQHARSAWHRSLEAIGSIRPSSQG